MCRHFRMRYSLVTVMAKNLIFPSTFSLFFCPSSIAYIRHAMVDTHTHAHPLTIKYQVKFWYDTVYTYLPLFSFHFFSFLYNLVQFDLVLWFCCHKRNSVQWCSHLSSNAKLQRICCEKCVFIKLKKHTKHTHIRPKQPLHLGEWESFYLNIFFSQIEK